MKSNFLKIFLLLALTAGFISCTDDDDNASDTEFFNLNTGTKWVYKKYENSVGNPEVMSFSGITDSVKVVGNVNLNGILFSKLEHRRFTEGNPVPQTEYEYLRVNAAGHLIGFVEYGEPDYTSVDETWGTVYHPGNDTAYQEVQNFDYGTMTLELSEPESITVEGNTYSVLPYIGFFAPSDPELTSKTIVYDYQLDIGLVRRLCHSVYGNYSWEDRLVSYELAE